jgi:hypothetical protein
MSVVTAQALLYLLAIALVTLAAIGVTAGRASLVLLGADAALLAFSLPTISAGL